MSSTGDRYEPLPGLLSIPAFLVRRLSPRGRKILALVAAVALVGAIVAAVILVPQITETKRDNAERARQESARVRAAERAKLRAEQRPHRGVFPAGSGRAVIVADLQSAILADARSRVSAGDLPGPAPKRVSCEPIEHRPDGYRCLAVTSDLPDTGETVGGTVGHPFAAVVHPETGRFSWCKVAGRPGELSIKSRFVVKLPRECGGS